MSSAREIFPCEIPFLSPTRIFARSSRECFVSGLYLRGNLGLAISLVGGVYNKHIKRKAERKRHSNQGDFFTSTNTTLREVCDRKGCRGRRRPRICTFR